MSNQQKPTTEQQVVPFFKAWESYLTGIKSVLASYEEHGSKCVSSEKFTCLAEVDKHFNLAIKPLLENLFKRNPLIHEGVGNAVDIMIYKRHIQFKWHPFSAELLPPRIKIEGHPLESEEDIQKSFKEYQKNQKEYWEKADIRERKAIRIYPVFGSGNPMGNGVPIHYYPYPSNDNISQLTKRGKEAVVSQGKSYKEAIKALVEREKTITLEQNKNQELSQTEKPAELGKEGIGDKNVSIRDIRNSKVIIQVADKAKQESTIGKDGYEKLKEVGWWRKNLNKIIIGVITIVLGGLILAVIKSYVF